MSTIELRRILIEKIKIIDDDKLLADIYRLLDITLKEPSGIYILNDIQKDAINEAREDIKNGKVFTDDESNKEINEWLK